MGKLGWIAVVGGIVVIMLIAGAIILFQPPNTQGAQKLDYGQAVQLDDFAFTALDSQKVKTIGDQTAQGIFYVVTLKVQNLAVRVSFKFQPETAVLVDNAGIEHTPLAQARHAWFTAANQPDACATELPAGTDCTTTLVYDVPADTQMPVLRVVFGGQFGEIADALLTGNRVLQLK